MRVTETLRGSQLLLDLQQAEERLMRAQNRIASGRKVSLPEDDPVATADGMRFDSELALDERIGRTAQSAGGWLQATDTALGSIGDILLRARELALQGASDAVPPESRQALAKEVDQLLQQLIQVGNSRFGGRYLFGGVQASGGTPPFQPDPSQANYGGYQASSVAISIDITGSGSAGFQLSVTGDQLEGAIQAVQNLETQLASGTATASSVAGAIPAIESALDDVLDLRATVGSRLNRIQDVQSRLQSDQLLLRQSAAKATDVDMTQATIDFSVAQYSYQAALAVGARVVQPSLVDYLR
ncbi:MAG: flagellar hook-associated protein FlgL [Bacillota bacterium]|nr:flagellar hook-associated protein FlgL [Bacillota bacterium]